MTGFNPFHLDRTTMNFGEALGIYLFQKKVLDDPRDVGQAEVIRVPSRYDHNGTLVPAQAHIRYITRSGEPTPTRYGISASVDEFTFELNQALDNFFVEESARVEATQVKAI